MASIPPAGNDVIYTLDDLRRMAEARRYPRWIVGQLGPHLRGRVVEIGGGVGSITEVLLETADHVVTVDKNPLCAAYLRHRFGADGRVEVVEGDFLEVEAPALTPASFDAVVSVNVIEHVADDERLVARAASLVKAGGVLFLVTPAHPSLYGTIDAALGHVRRYDRAEILRKTARWFEPVRCAYMNAPGALVWWWNNRVARATRQSIVQIWIFDRLVVPWLSRLERLVPPPFGQSVWFVGRRHGGP